MVDRGCGLPLSRQCALLGVSRSSQYYEPLGESAENLGSCARLDELHLEQPFYGSRQMARHLRREGVIAGRHRVRRLMRLMGMEAVYRRPRTSAANPEHRVYPYLLRDLAIDRPALNARWKLKMAEQRLQAAARTGLGERSEQRGVQGVRQVDLLAGQRGLCRDAEARPAARQSRHGVREPKVRSPFEPVSSTLDRPPRRLASGHSMICRKPAGSTSSPSARCSPAALRSGTTSGSRRNDCS